MSCVNYLFDTVTNMGVGTNLEGESIYIGSTVSGVFLHNWLTPVGEGGAMMRQNIIGEKSVGAELCLRVAREGREEGRKDIFPEHVCK